MHYDAIIIGTGAGGGTLAYRLAHTGKKILVLERGDFLPREKANWDTAEVFIRARYKAKETWLDADGKEFHPGIHYWVGGNTKVYGAALLRFRREDFGEIRHEEGLSPAWPIGYDEMSPYYDAAERIYNVHGTRGADPSDPGGTDYPHPAVAHETRIAHLAHDLEKLGYKPFPLPLALNLDESNPRKSACIKCESCDGFPCLLDGKADAHVNAIEPALRHDNVTLLTNRLVQWLETSPDGRTVTKVHVKHGKEQEVYSANVVIVACGAINSAALLLRSANEKHPRGLANSSDQLGRNYMCHNNSALLALSREPNPTKFQKTLGINDFYFGGKHYEWPLGHVQMLGKSDEEMFKGEAPPLVPGWTLRKMAEHALDFWITSEDLPDPNNRVVVGVDDNIRLQYRANNVKPHLRLVNKLKSILDAIGCLDGHLHSKSLYLGKKIPVAGTAHQCGTARFGHDPRSSVLDRDCKAHDLDNLYVVDGSFFPSSTAVNPALTIMANALRVGDHLAGRL